MYFYRFESSLLMGPDFIALHNKNLDTKEVEELLFETASNMKRMKSVPLDEYGFAKKLLLNADFIIPEETIVDIDGVLEFATTDTDE